MIAGDAARAFATALALAALPAAAGPLAPSKPSQLVSARAVSTPCPFETQAGNNAYEITSMSTPDGVQAPFAIPPKQVFVITSAYLTLTGGPANDTAQLYLFAVEGESGSILTEGVAATNASGLAIVERVLPTGIAVKSGKALCVLGSQGNSLGSVTGFFAKDK
jgi:hypothetical protein